MMTNIMCFVLGGLCGFLLASLCWMSREADDDGSTH